MAKTDTKKQEKAFASVLKKAASAYKGEERDELEPITELVVSFLVWNATAKQADTAFGKVMAQVVDLNELRVSHASEVVELIGVRYPDAQRRSIRLLESMMEIFEREHDYKMTSVASRSKREQRDYLDTLPGIPSFVAARVALLACGCHAMPVDDRLLALLVKAGVFDPTTSPAEAESWLMRQVKAGDAEHAYLTLQAWADGQRVTLPKPAAPKVYKVLANEAGDKPSEKKAKQGVKASPVTKKAVKKATASKKTTKKKAAKKTAAKKATKKRTTPKK